MNVIAFDAAKRVTGYAYKYGGVWVTGTLCPTDTPKLTSVVRSALVSGVDTAVIENCYLGANCNVHTVKALQDAQTRIAVRCEDAGLEVLLIYPQTWQAAFGITGPSNDRKLGAARVAQMLGAAKGQAQDVYDAVCLCEYAMTQDLT